MLEFVQGLTMLVSDSLLLKFFLVLLGVGLGGEVILIPFAFLSAQGFVSWPILGMAGFLGTYATDTFWFFVGRGVRFGKILEHRFAQNTVSVIHDTVERLSRGSPMLSLIFAKFIFGTRILTILHVSRKNVSTQKFLYYNAVAVLLWIFVIIPIGYASGLGFTYVASVFQNIYATLGFIALVVVFIVMLQVWIKKFFTGQNLEE